MRLLSFFLLLLIFVSCGAQSDQNNSETTENEFVEDSLVITEEPLFCNNDVTVGAGLFDSYLNELEGKSVALVGNQSSMIGEVHLVDTLMAQGVNLVKVFSPEHGFRGDADAGEKVKDGKDPKTGLPIISLYGKNKKPKEGQLADVDVILFDIQDVGARFYTYISTMTYVMEAAAENGKKVIVLDRPNPNGHYVDGPVLKSGYSSFVGMHQVPIVHGMSIGEYAQMVNEEGWLSNGAKCDLQVVACEGWDHTKFYELPIAPSPNLPNMKSVYWYPSLCLFEGTIVSIGRGTDIPFQCVGHPGFKDEEADHADTLHWSFTPAPNDGSSNPKLNGRECFGFDLSAYSEREIRNGDGLDLWWIILFYDNLNLGDDFFLSTNFINLLYGSNQLQKDLKNGLSAEEIKESWQEDLNAFKEIRKKYLLYTDFE